MIESLNISNYALIDKIEIDFSRGFNTITGETGAGKSIMLGALSLLMGERADSKVVRDSAKKSVIEASFTVDDYPGLEDYFRANELEWDPERCILRREIAPGGRSRAFVNDSPVNLSQLRGVAMHLVDIHSQHQNQLLTTPEYQLGIIDHLAGTAQLLEQYRKTFDEYRRRRRRLVEVREMIARNNSEAEYIRFQHDQLELMRLQPGEQTELERERDLLSNMTDIKTALRDALDRLTDGTPNVLSMLDRTVADCRTLGESIEEAVELTERIDSAVIELRDIADTLSDYDSRLQADPEQLESVEERLNDIYELQRKHHVDTVEELIDLQKSLANKLRAIDNSEGTLDALRMKVEEARDRAMSLAGQLSDRRHEAAKEFAGKLKATALPLGMKNLQCEIAVRPTQLSPTGIDNVEFLFAFNKNQPLMPVGGTASGGEISRLMLSIKALIARKMQLPSIIFDEVDTGVSGDVANRMGDMMASIASHIQVITITHLPQVAAKGGAQYKVYKEDSENATTTRIRRLDTDERVGELALMLSGDSGEPTARATARTLLGIK